MRLRLKIAFNTLVQILGKIISAGCTFLITVLMARKFGVTGFGEFVKITTYVSLFYLVVDFGLNAVTLKEVSNSKLKTQNSIFERSEKTSDASRVKLQLNAQNLRIEARSYFSNLLGLRIVFALLLIFFALAILAFLPFNPLTLEGFTPLSKLGIIILAPTILTQAIFTSCNAIFQKRLRYDLSVLASSLGSLVTLGLVYLIIKINASLLFIVGSYLIGGTIMVALSLYLSRLGWAVSVGHPEFISEPVPNSFRESQILKQVQNDGRAWLNLNLWRHLFLKSFPLGLTLIFNLIYFKADTLILTLFRPTQEVGIYGLAKSFFEFPLAIPTFFMNAVYPILLSEKRKAKSEKLIKKSAIFLIFSSLLLSLICYLLSPHIVLIKPEFAPSIFVFRILSLYLPIFFLSSLFMWTMIAFGKQKLLALIYSNAMIINLLLNFIFIPRFGYSAAVIILGISELIVLGLTGGFWIIYES